MDRSTALIRQWLLLELEQNSVNERLRQIKRVLQSADIAIVERDDRPQEIWVRYKLGQRWYEATYMRAMLEAELYGRGWCNER